MASRWSHNLLHSANNKNGMKRINWFLCYWGISCSMVLVWVFVCLRVGWVTLVSFFNVRYFTSMSAFHLMMYRPLCVEFNCEAKWSRCTRTIWPISQNKCSTSPFGVLHINGEWNIQVALVKFARIQRYLRTDPMDSYLMCGASILNYPKK